MDNLKAAFDNTDWALLKTQKLALVETLNQFDTMVDARVATATDRLHLDGILNWMDALQDAAELDGYPVQFLDEFVSTPECGSDCYDNLKHSKLCPHGADLYE